MLQPHSPKHRNPKPLLPDNLRPSQQASPVHSDMSMVEWSLIPDCRPAAGGPTERKFEWFSLVGMLAAFSFSIPYSPAPRPPPFTRALDQGSNTGP